MRFGMYNAAPLSMVESDAIDTGYSIAVKVLEPAGADQSNSNSWILIAVLLLLLLLPGKKQS
jgi:hypothetical protein